MSAFVLHHGDVLDVLRGMPDASFDAVFSDVPYGLGSREPTVDELVAYLTGAELDLGGDFMSADWKIPSVAVWRELLRVLKPGAPVLAFAGSKTQDLIAIGMRAAGFEIRDCVMWMYAQGWAKGLAMDKAIDALNGDEREVVGEKETGRARAGSAWREGSAGGRMIVPVTAPASSASAPWAGHGTGLAPSYEPCLLAMKPLEGTFAKNAIKHGVAGINVDGARIATDWSERSEAWKRSGHSAKPDAEKIAAPPGIGITCHPGGRWPKNVVLDEGAAALLDEQSGQLHGAGYRTDGAHRPPTTAPSGYGGSLGPRLCPRYGDNGGASRMFYVAKASRAERELGCEHLPVRAVRRSDDDGEVEDGVRNNGPCIKPLKLVRYLATLIQPPKRAHAPRRLLVPYAGTGSEMIGALRAGWEEVVGIEREGPEGEDYLAIANARIERWASVPEDLDEGEAVSVAGKAAAGQLGLFGGGR